MMKWRGGFTMLAAGGVIAMAGCQDSPLEPGTPETGTLAMSYVDGGGFQAAGAPVFSGSEVAPGPFAIAVPDSLGGVVVSAFSQTGGTRGDLFILQLGEGRQGTFSPCDMFSSCHGRLLEDIDAADLADVGRAWEIVEGSVQVDAFSPDHIRGSFEGLVLESPAPGQDSTSSGTIATERRTVEDGTFDLPLLSEDEGVGVMRCFLARATGAPAC